MPLDQRRELIQKTEQLRRRASALYTKMVIVLYAIVMVLLVLMLRSAHGPFGPFLRVFLYI